MVAAVPVSAIVRQSLTYVNDLTLPRPLPRREGSLLTDEAEVRFVDEGGGLQRLAGFLVGELCRGEPSQLIVNDGEELVLGAGMPLFELHEDLRYIAHEAILASAPQSCTNATERRLRHAALTKRGLVTVRSRGRHGPWHNAYWGTAKRRLVTVARGGSLR
jgi:hypothetical protein